MDKIIELMIAAHDPLAVNNSMVSELWADGEITLTKGGDLFRMRSIHQINPNFLSKGQTLYISERLLEAIPDLQEVGGIAAIMPRNEKAAIKIRAAMLELVD